MQPLAYLHLQLRLEGKEIIHGSLLKEVEAVPGEEVPLLLLAKPTDGNFVVYYDEAVARDLHERLAAAVLNIDFPQINPLLDVLKNRNIPFEAGHYKTYVFPSHPVVDRGVLHLSKTDQRVKTFGFDGFADPVCVIEKDGIVLSACVSARENATSGEAWVYTAPQYRHQGFAQQVVNAWAESLRRAGKVPFYSHKIDNLASANLAGRLKLQPVFEEIAITRTSW